jgi:hypothetical protein
MNRNLLLINNDKSNLQYYKPFINYTNNNNIHKNYFEHGSRFLTDNFIR